MDEATNLAAIREVVREFVNQRNWQQFHSPKNLSMALAIEAAELMEHFQWLSIDESRGVVRDDLKLSAIGEEIADVFCYTLALANELNLDLTSIFLRKMERNRAKYPVAEFRGRFGEEDPRPVSEGT